MWHVLVVAVLALMFAAVECFSAEKYPVKPITMIIPFPAGGSTDAIGRTLAEKLKTHLGQPILIENKSSLQVGLRDIKQAKADGYTVSFVNSNYLTISPHMANVPYKGPSDFATIAWINTHPVVLAVNPKSPWNSLKDLLEAGKASPGKIRVASSVLGSVNHLNFAMLTDMAKSPLVYVPFAGGPPAIAAFLGGHAEAVILAVLETKPHVDAGKARVLGVFGEKRSPHMPDIPTFKEQGYDIHFMTNGVMIGPKDFPNRSKSVLEDACKKVTANPEFVKAIYAVGSEVIFVGSDDLAKRLAREYDDSRVLVERLGLKQK